MSCPALFEIGFMAPRLESSTVILSEFLCLVFVFNLLTTAYPRRKAGSAFGLRVREVHGSSGAGTPVSVGGRSNRRHAYRDVRRSATAVLDGNQWSVHGTSGIAQQNAGLQGHPARCQSDRSTEARRCAPHGYSFTHNGAGAALSVAGTPLSSDHRAATHAYGPPQTRHGRQSTLPHVAVLATTSLRVTADRPTLHIDTLHVQTGRQQPQPTAAAHDRATAPTAFRNRPAPAAHCQPTCTGWCKQRHVLHVRCTTGEPARLTRRSLDAETRRAHALAPACYRQIPSTANTTHCAHRVTSSRTRHPLAASHVAASSPHSLRSAPAD